jgi:hypothetical protein
MWTKVAKTIGFNTSDYEAGITGGGRLMVAAPTLQSRLGSLTAASGLPNRWVGGKDRVWLRARRGQ